MLCDHQSPLPVSCYPSIAVKQRETALGREVKMENIESQKHTIKMAITWMVGIFCTDFTAHSKQIHEKSNN